MVKKKFKNFCCCKFCLTSCQRFKPIKLQEKEIKPIQIRKEEGKLSLFADIMILNAEDPKEYTPMCLHKPLLKLINKFSDVTEYKISMQK